MLAKARMRPRETSAPRRGLRWREPGGDTMWKTLCALGLAVLPGIAWAGCFWSHVDHLPSASEAGAWRPSVYRGVVDSAAVAEVAGALWEGADSRIGRTM